jgi:transposase
MDVHQDAIAGAYVAQDHGAEGLDRGALGTRPCDLDQLIRTRTSNAPHFIFVPAASPCGSWLSRDLTHNGDACWVAAPSLRPKKAGDRVNTDRRDAVPRARLARAGDLTAVDVPPVDDAAMRALTRAREDALRELTDATCRLKACVLRPASQQRWSVPHRRRTSSVKKMCVRFMRRPHASSVSNRHGQIT